MPHYPLHRFITCVNFQVRARGRVANPLVVQRAKFTKFDVNGVQTPDGRIWEINGHRGLDCGHILRIELPRVSARVTLEVVHSATPGRILAKDAQGNNVSTKRIGQPQGVAQAFNFSAQAGIKQIEIRAPQDETILLYICWV